MKSKHLFYAISLVLLLAFVLAILNLIYRDWSLSAIADVHVSLNNAASRQREPDYSFASFWKTLPASTRSQVPYCELPDINTQRSNIESSTPFRCVNTGQLPTSVQSDLWDTYIMWKDCHAYGDENACNWLLN